MRGGQSGIGLFLVSFIGGIAMIFLGESLTGCLSSKFNSPGPNCLPYSNPLATAIVFVGLGLIVFAFWATLYRKPPKTKKTEPFAPDEDGFYPLKNQNE